MSAIDRALADSQRSLMSCKAAVGSQAISSLLAQGPSGAIVQRTDSLRAAEQYRHFKNWAFSAIRPICQKIAETPIRVGRVTSGRKLGTKQAHDVDALDQHPFLDLLADPNPLMTQWHLIYTIVASMEITGRALLWLPQKKQIWPIPISWLTNLEGGSKWTEFKVRSPWNAEEFALDADQCVYSCYPDPSDPHGAISPLNAAWSAIDCDEQIIATQANIFRRGIMPTSALILGEDPETKLRPKLNSAQQRQIIDAVRKRWSGSYHAGEPLILDGLIQDVKNLTTSPREMDFAVSGDVVKARIFQAFGVSPIIAGEIEGSNRASSDAADRHFIQYCIGPKLECLSQTLTSWLRVVYGEKDLVVWFEKPVANDAEIELKWATLLSQYSAITGDELRSLTPFGLEAGKFPNPVTPGKTQEERQIDDAADQLSKAMDVLDPLRLIGGDRHEFLNNGHAR